MIEWSSVGCRPAPKRGARGRRSCCSCRGNGKRTERQARLLFLERGPGHVAAEFARVAKAEHRIEECLERAKSEAGLADYQVRTWEGGIIIKRCRCWPRGS